MPTQTSNDQILSIDIGGSHVKATILNSRGDIMQEYQKVDTPVPANPEKLVEAINELVSKFSGYQKISVGFPGYVKDGIVITAPNLGTTAWAGFNLKQKLQDDLAHPVQLLNDADMQGLGVVSGKGLELVITLGTGFGTALLLDGKLLPHLEMAHHPFTKHKSYDDYIGEKALKSKGVERWNNRIKNIISVFKVVFNYDFLYIGGGNASKINFKLDPNIKLVTNMDGIKGGAKLWVNEPSVVSEKEALKT